MSEVKRLNSQLRRAYEGEAWYGPALREVLTGVTAEQAAAKPVPAAHSIWELVLHIKAWEGAVRRRLIEGIVELPVEGDWPAVPTVSEANWQQTLAELEEGHQALRRVIAELTEERLAEPVGQAVDKATGSGVSVYGTIQGIIQHNVYHAGQIALLKKAGQ